ncbi:MAG: hypothetical protein WCJ55_07585, partial [Chloroflexales bacterium]
AEALLGLGNLTAAAPAEGVGVDILRARLEALLADADADEGDLPLDADEGDLPLDVDEGDLPLDVDEGDLPLDVDEGDLPLDAE